jgi:hypothetical protein
MLELGMMDFLLANWT